VSPAITLGAGRPSIAGPTLPAFSAGGSQGLRAIIFLKYWTSSISCWTPGERCQNCFEIGPFRPTPPHKWPTSHRLRKQTRLRACAFLGRATGYPVKLPSSTREERCWPSICSRDRGRAFRLRSPIDKPGRVFLPMDVFRVHQHDAVLMEQRLSPSDPGARSSPLFRKAIQGLRAGESLSRSIVHRSIEPAPIPADRRDATGLCRL